MDTFSLTIFMKGDEIKDGNCAFSIVGHKLESHLDEVHLL